MVASWALRLPCRQDDSRAHLETRQTVVAAAVLGRALSEQGVSYHREGRPEASLATWWAGLGNRETPDGNILQTSGLFVSLVCKLNTSLSLPLNT